ncbi:MAG: alpha-ketoacid dehydrogenase subunit beta [Rhodospirillaceae bacterium]|nr:alpha-ketoacid dehydrogenase subunit beta [Rhodospirillaceae bacterium]
MSMPECGARVLSYVDALREGITQEMARDPSVLLFGLDVDDHKAIQGSTRGLVDRFGPERVFGTPLSEDAMTGVAIGAAMTGLRPIHVHIRNDFLMLAMNQIVNVAAKAHSMYGGRVSVPLVIRSIIGKSWGQGAQHSQALYPLFMHVPGLKVVLPSTAHDAKGCMIAAIRDDNPVIFIEHRLLYFTETEVPEAPYAVEPGRARICAAGDAATVVGISNAARDCLRARALLQDTGITCEVIDPIWLSPLDTDTILASAARTKRLLVVDNGWTTCGAGAEIIARVLERAGPGAGIQVDRMGFAPTPCPTTPWLEADFYPQPERIARKVLCMVTGRDDDWTPNAAARQQSEDIAFKGPF